MGAATIVCRNPADAREVVATYEAHEPAGVAAMCARAQIAQARWGGLPGPRRGELLHRAADLLRRRGRRLAQRIVAEEGKLLADAAGEVERAAAVLQFHAGEAERMGGELADAAQAGTLAFTRRRPLGVVALITPWNFPIAIPAWKLAPALAAGNAVVIKPASAAPGAVLELVEVLHEAGVPADAVQVALGGAEVGLALADDPHVRALSFTGSTAVGRALARRVGARIRFQGELGGNNPLVVLADADPARAVALACEGAFAAAGQKCTATRRLIVERPAYKLVLEAFAERASALVLGAGAAAGAEVPPLIDAAAVEGALAAVAQARAGGAELVSGGTRPNGELRHGSFLAPTVLAGVRAGMRVVDEEVFGPVCGVQSARDLDEAIALANAVPYGLSASICTNDLHRAFAFVARSDAGMVHVNRPTPGGDPHLPFGGLKASTASGWREQGTEAVRFFSEQQTVYVHHGEP
ncbi:MAG TPA: aldehyde dehydrogenase family protein [Solirubrobacteraceae bacterium]|jgi:acyl-CoA reductase-like NAD-dependent aldehyde dehydrogenase|nr:aldehyde dehydrogenase family protein [Solirubrobacteraceae bacterium]